LDHESGEAHAFYRSLQSSQEPVRVGIQATGPIHWFERLLAELGHQLWIGGSAKIRASEVRKQKTDERDARLILDLPGADQKSLFALNGEVGIVNGVRFEYRIELKTMADQPPADRFKSEMPEIPGVAGPGPRRGSGGNPATRMVVGLLGLLLVVFVGARWALRPKHVDAPPAEQQPQIEVPSPAPDPSTLLPHATETNPGIADIAEMAKPWTSKQFYIRNGLTGENIAAMLIRLPTASAAQASSYWAFSLNSPYGNCQLEYITDLAKLKTEYGFKGANHPMVGNPCSRTLFDPLKMATLPGNFLVRGAIAQGSDLRPPLAVEIKIQGKNILAVRTE
jgi:hypothetical protein